jgi:hypothetical protein
MMTRDAKAQERKWKAESDLRALSEAVEIRRDRSRVRAARGVAKKQMTNLRRIAGGRR